MEQNVNGLIYVFWSKYGKTVYPSDRVVSVLSNLIAPEWPD